jgi:hypothetical protein
MAEKDLFKWILSYERLAAQRLAAHELNNYMTPLAMQLSMLKTHLGSGQLEKAEQRIEKLENALAKLEEYSKSQFVKVSAENITMIKLDQTSVESFVKQLLHLLRRDEIRLTISDLQPLADAEVSEYHLAIFLYKIIMHLDETCGIDQLVFATAEAHEGIILNLQVVPRDEPEVAPPIHPEIQRCTKLINASKSHSHLSVIAHSSFSYALAISP